MPSFWKWRRVVLVRTDVLQERIISIIRVKEIGELGKTLAAVFFSCYFLVTFLTL
jgi:hypothetical protein